MAWWQCCACACYCLANCAAQGQCAPRRSMEPSGCLWAVLKGNSPLWWGTHHYDTVRPKFWHHWSRFKLKNRQLIQINERALELFLRTTTFLIKNKFISSQRWQKTFYSKVCTKWVNLSAPNEEVVFWHFRIWSRILWARYCFIVF